jgi:uncharacterized protein YndB with AHSA1/START domain
MSEQKSKVPRIERIFDAPREMVWRAWTEPELVKKWWGPKDFTAPEAKIDLRVGGKYLYAMRGPAGSQWDKVMWSGGEFKEIVPMEKIVAEDYFTDDKGNRVSPSSYGMGTMPEIMHVTVTFQDAGPGKTKLTIQYAEEIPDDHRKGMEDGWGSSLDKFAKVVESS